MIAQSDPSTEKTAAHPRNDWKVYLVWTMHSKIGECYSSSTKSLRKKPRIARVGLDVMALLLGYILVHSIIVNRFAETGQLEIRRS